MKNLNEEKANIKRKQLLKIIDKQEKVSNVEIGMYGLTSYFEDEDDSCSLCEKILFYENEKRLINHISQNNCFFMPKQQEALTFLQDNDRCIISAPTSFGKTLIVKEYIFLNKPNVVVFIVPTNALAFELENEFKRNKNFKDFYTIFDRTKIDANLPTQPLLFIGTQEKYKEISDSIKNIDLFVIDEAYKLEESSKKLRGYSLSETFLESINKKSKKIILLCPIANLIGFEKYEFRKFPTIFNAVDKDYHIVTEEKFYPLLLEKVKKQEKTILYCEAPDDMLELCDILDNVVINNDSYIAFLEKEFHPEWSVIKLLKKGILCHHGIMPKFVQNKMLKKFIENNDYPLLVGTNSISEGINTPTKNIFFKPGCDFSNNRLLLKNTIGRAGRLKKFPIGHIYSVENLEKIDSNEIDVTLGLADESNVKELKESNDSVKIKVFCEQQSISEDFYFKELSSAKLSFSKLKRIFEVLREDLKYVDLSELPKMASTVFLEDYSQYHAFIDRFCIKGILQEYYYADDAHINKKFLNSYTNKISFFNKQYDSYRKNNSNAQVFSESEIIEFYMRCTYSSIDYYILPIMKIAKILNEAYPEWPFGKNVVSLCKNFFKKYYTHIYGFNIEEWTDNQKKIALSLREYGISIKSMSNNETVVIEMLNEIEKELKNRYSTFDIVNSIKRLSLNSVKYKFSFKILEKNYL